MLASIPRLFSALFARAPKDTVAGPLDHKTHCRTFSDDELLDSLFCRLPQTTAPIEIGLGVSILTFEEKLVDSGPVDRWEARMQAKLDQEHHDRVWQHVLYYREGGHSKCFPADEPCGAEGAEGRWMTDAETVDYFQLVVLRQLRVDALMLEERIKFQRELTMEALCRKRDVRSGDDLIYDVGMFNHVARMLGQDEIDGWLTWDEVRAGRRSGRVVRDFFKAGREAREARKGNARSQSV